MCCAWLLCVCPTLYSFKSYFSDIVMKAIVYFMQSCCSLPGKVYRPCRKDTSTLSFHKQAFLSTQNYFKMTTPPRSLQRRSTNHVYKGYCIIANDCTFTQSTVRLMKIVNGRQMNNFTHYNNINACQTLKKSHHTQYIKQNSHVYHFMAQAETR